MLGERLKTSSCGLSPAGQSPENAPKAPDSQGRGQGMSWGLGRSLAILLSGLVLAGCRLDIGEKQNGLQKTDEMGGAHLQSHDRLILSF